MKKLHILLLVTSIIFNITACKDELNDELYTHMVSLKAPVDATGLYPVYMRYRTDGIVNYDLPVILSGSSNSEKDIDVKIGVDPDTLSVFNYEKFQYRSDLYYKQLPEKFYEFVSPSVRISKGEHTSNFPITFKFKDLDLVEQWVLPLMIKDDASYLSNHRKGWRKALLFIRPFNDYSGTYSSTAMNVYFGTESDKTMVVNTRTAFVLDENSVFFYAGMTDERDINRSKYKISVQFGEATEGDFGIKSGPLTVKAADDKINFSLAKPATYSIRETPDLTLPYLIHRYYTINLEYQYDDISSVPGTPLTYRAKGSMTMERKLNTLMPDEDQAIQW